jgi:putative flippase GtrA
MAKLLRFSLVGLLNAIVYALATQFFIQILALDAGLSGLLGYSVAIPFAYWGHRVVSFRADGAVPLQLVKFIGAQVLGLMVSWVTMWVCVERLQQPAMAGILVTIAIVPLLSFVVLDKLVFSTRPYERL